MRNTSIVYSASENVHVSREMGPSSPCLQRVWPEDDSQGLSRILCAMFGKMERPIRPNGVSWPLKTEWLLNNVVRS